MLTLTLLMAELMLIRLERFLFARWMVVLQPVKFFTLQHNKPLTALVAQ
jgi:hypothetical protein